MAQAKNKMGLWMLTTLVAGNMIGSGVFLLPANLASFGTIGLLAWVATSIGAILLASVFARMSLLVPKPGGPYAFARAGYGDFVGLQMAYNYWVALWVGNAAISLALVGYLRVFFPVLDNPWLTCFVAIAAIWVFALVNIAGIRRAGAMQVVTTICKLIPIVAVGTLGWWYFHPHLLVDEFNLSGHNSWDAFTSAATLTLWSFIGLESATIPSDSVENPRRNIPIATMLGTLIASVAYIASATAIMGMIPAKELAHSTAPFAAAAMIIFGNWGQWLVAAGAVISCMGALNGWILLQGQVAMAAADDGIFPKIFALRNKQGIPAWGLAITNVLISLLLLLTVSPNLVAQFQLVILVATLASLIPYFYTAIAEVILRRITNPKRGYPFNFHLTLAMIAAAYAFWAIIGAGQTVVFYGMILFFLTVPMYAIMHRKIIA